MSDPVGTPGKRIDQEEKVSLPIEDRWETDEIAPFKVINEPTRARDRNREQA